MPAPVPPAPDPDPPPFAGADDVSSLGEAWAVVRLRRDGSITSVNAGAAALAGLPAERVVGRHYLDFVGTAARSRAADTFRAVLAGAPARFAVAPVWRPDGTSTMVAWTVVPTRDRAGDDAGVLAAGMPLPNVTSGEPDHAAEQFWRGVFDASPLAVVVVSADDHVLGVNPRFSELFGYDEGEALGRALHALIGAPADAVSDAARQLAAGVRVVLDAERRAKSGAWLPVHVEAMAFDLDGRRALVVAYRHLAEQRAFEAHVVRAQRLAGVALVAAGVLHDINNLLMVVLGHAELLAAAESDAPFDADRREDVAVLRDAARRAAALTRTVGSFARPGGARTEPVDVGALVAQLRPVLAGLAGRQVALEVEAGPGAGPVDAVPAELEQVLINLAANARDAMPNGGTLRVAARRTEVDAALAARRALDPGSYIALDVADTGTGMPPEVARRACEPFFSTKGEAGTGLGLATVERIVRRTGGAVWIETAEGAGTTVHVVLPVSAGPK